MKINIEIYIIIILSFNLIGCNDDSTPKCTQGKVIGYQNCYEMYIIEVHSENLGEPLSLGNNNFGRAVQSPLNYFTGDPPNSEDTIYFRYRLFDPSLDALPEKNQDELCHPSVFPLSIPTIIITHYSTEKCL